MDAPEVVASGQRWPWSLQVDNRTAYWLDLGNPESFLEASLASASLDGSSGPRVLVPDLRLFVGWQLAMNSHHLYWLEDKLDPMGDIRTLAK